MQSNSIQSRGQSQAAERDFDFGAARRKAGESLTSSGRPGLVAALVGFAFAIALLTPVAGQAESIRERPEGFRGSPIWVPPAKKPEPGHGKGHDRDRDHRYEKKHDKHPHGKGKYGKHKKMPDLPRACAISIDARGGKTWYFADCLRDRGISSKILPRECAADAKVGGRRERVYAGDCLRRAGFGR